MGQGWRVGLRPDRPVRTTQRSSLQCPGERRASAASGHGCPAWTRPYGIEVRRLDAGVRPGLPLPAQDGLKVLPDKDIPNFATGLSGALVEGLFYYREQTHMACLDLRKKP